MMANGLSMQLKKKQLSMLNGFYAGRGKRKHFDVANEVQNDLVSSPQTSSDVHTKTKQPKNGSCDQSSVIYVNGYMYEEEGELKKKSKYGFDIESNEYCLEKLHREIKEDINSSKEYIDAVESMTAEMKKQCPEKFKIVA